MVSKTVQAPTSLLTDPDLTPGAKVLWLTVRQHTEATTLTNLASASGLTVATIRHGLAQLTASGWYSPKTGALEHQSIAERVSIPPGLLSDRRVGPQAKLIYGMLQTVASFQSGDGKSTFAALGERAGVSAKTARKAVHELAGTGWIEASQA
ncbi:MAG TPA: hypothetical protein VD902_01635, partial [Symbiobacteriaceae bacterium]|nr:hypothetical protein [Symbiobacteriaceae bacterium]